MRTHFLGPFAVAGGATTASLVYFLRYPRQLPQSGPPEAGNDLFTGHRAASLARVSLKTLVRSLFVHAFCTHPRLVDAGIYLVQARQGRPTPILDYVVRHTFFAHFCGYVHNVRSTAD